MENGSLGDFPSSVYRLLIMQTEVCCLSICLRRNKRKLSVFKWTKQTKHFKWTCPSMQLSHSVATARRFGKSVKSLNLFTFT